MLGEQLLHILDIGFHGRLPAAQSVAVRVSAQSVSRCRCQLQGVSVSVSVSDLAMPFLLSQESHLAFPFRSSIPGLAVLQSPIEPWGGIDKSSVV